MPPHVHLPRGIHLPQCVQLASRSQATRTADEDTNTACSEQLGAETVQPERAALALAQLAMTRDQMKRALALVRALADSQVDEAGDIRGIEHGPPYDYVLDARRLVEEIDQWRHQEDDAMTRYELLANDQDAASRLYEYERAKAYWWPWSEAWDEEYRRWLANAMRNAGWASGDP